MSKRILFVDDDTTVRTAFTKILENYGFEVTALPDGTLVEKVIKKEKFDLIVTDIVMPEKEGLATIMDIRSYDKNLPILAISGGGRIMPQDHLAIALKMGANDTLTKPFDGATLVKKINEILGI